MTKVTTEGISLLTVSDEDGSFREDNNDSGGYILTDQRTEDKQQELKVLQSSIVDQLLPSSPSPSTTTTPATTPEYGWRRFAPMKQNWTSFCQWVFDGGSTCATPQSDDELVGNLRGLAECLVCLREYHAEYGMPHRGGPRDQELVLREVYKDLYAGGAPIWALTPILQKAAEGLTGHERVSLLSLPRQSFIQDPVSMTTSMFRCERGFDICKMDAMEPVAVRLASFGTNTTGATNTPARQPTPKDLYLAYRATAGGSMRFLTSANKPYHEYDYPEYGTTVGAGERTSSLARQEGLARRILDLSSRYEGIFHFAHIQELPHTGTANVTLNSIQQQEIEDERIQWRDRWTLMEDGNTAFWTVSETERELFTRLATIEALRAIEHIDRTKPTLYSPATLDLFRLLSSAMACGFWFQGSWYDMLVAAVLSMMVALIGRAKNTTKQERIVMEIVASFSVGLSAGMIALTWPKDTCFSAMALGGILDIFQGFRIVYAVIEIMSKHTVAGGADLLEGILFTGLIAYFLRFGQYVAVSLLGDTDVTRFVACKQGVDPWWYLILVPIAAVSWSGLFNPNHADLPVMALHGTMAYSINFGLSSWGVDDNLNNFLSSLVSSFTAGMVSRFTGKQAVANTVAAIYALVPGAYLVTALLTTGSLDNRFLTNIIQRSVIIGLGAWTGSMLCSPTLLGSTGSVLTQQQQLQTFSTSSTTDRSTILYF